MGSDGIRIASALSGASTSDVGYSFDSPSPSPEKPLGVEFPGITYAEFGKPNWIGHLIDKYTKSSPLVYNYAVGGHTLPGYTNQIRLGFLKGPASKQSEIPWAATNSLFISWIGGNDVANPEADLESSLTKIFELQGELYDAGARNFLFFNIAPLPRTMDKPNEITTYMLEKREEKCQEWNELLPRFLDDFSKTRPEASTFLFDTYKSISHMLAAPTEYGFPANAGSMYDHIMYVDNIHPTSKVHEVLARQIGSFLAGEEFEEGRRGKYSSM
ncbi:hypothetical protein FRB99_004106 [Tulasnella sp. 403]|nr:hypothetical protein FRB99_004106 [Tulasnella sp. 403]